MFMIFVCFRTVLNNVFSLTKLNALAPSNIGKFQDVGGGRFDTTGIKSFQKLKYGVYKNTAGEPNPEVCAKDTPEFDPRTKEPTCENFKCVEVRFNFQCCLCAYPAYVCVECIGLVRQG